MVPTPLFSVILERMSFPQIAQHAAGVGQLGAAQVDLVVCHHLHEFEDLLPARNEAWAEHVVDAEGLGWRGGRRGGVVHSGWELLCIRLFVVSLYVAVAKLELIQAASREPVYAPSGRRAQFRVPSAASTQYK